MGLEGVTSATLCAKAIGCSNMLDRTLSALISAWITTFIATTLLATALAIAPVWSSAVYLRALPSALSMAP